MGSDNIFQLNIEALYINIPFSDLYITHIDYISVEHSISTEVPPSEATIWPCQLWAKLVKANCECLRPLSVFARNVEKHQSSQS